MILCNQKENIYKHKHILLEFAHSLINKYMAFSPLTISRILIYIYVLILLSCTLVSGAEQVSANDPDDSSINKDDVFLQWLRSYINRIPTKQVAPTDSTNPQRRNVMLPRICYFTRVTKSGIYQKLCLPYDRDAEH